MLKRSLTRALPAPQSGDRRGARSRDRGATAVEYGLIIGLIAFVIFVAVALFGNNMLDSYNNSYQSIASAQS